MIVGAMICKTCQLVLLPVFLLNSFVHSLPSNFLNFTGHNFPRQFVQQPLPAGEIINPVRPTNTNTIPSFISTNPQSGNTDINNENHLFPYPHPQRPIFKLDYETTSTTENYYTSSTTDTSTTEFTSTTTDLTSTTTDYSTTTTEYPTSTTEEYDSSSTTTTESNDYDSSEEEEDGSFSSTITPFLKPDLPGFPIDPPPFPVLPTAGGQLPKPSISSTLLSNYPQQHIDGAVGPFPDKIQEQQGPGGLAGLGAGVGQLLQRLNPFQLLRPVTDTFQNIGHVLSHPNYGPGSAFLRPIQFWSAVNAAGNPSLAPYRKLPANVIVTSDNRK